MKVTTSHLDLIYITDSSGVGKTSLTFETAGLSAYWMRNNDSGETAITLVTMTLGTWVSGGFKEVDATNFPGLYQIGVPNAAVATGATSVVIGFKGVADCVFTPLRIVLEEADLTAVQIREEIDVNSSMLESIKQDTELVRKLQLADIRLNTTSTPWQELWYESGTETVLMTKELFDSSGNPVDSIETYVASKVELVV